MSVQAISGAFPQSPGPFPTPPGAPPIVLVDGQLTAPSGYTGGGIRTATVQIQPTLTQAWKLIGFSVVAQFGIARASLIRPVYARLGTVWAGLLVDKVIGDFQSLAGRAGVATLPQDLSTFAKVFDPGNDPPPPLTVNGIGVLPAGQGNYGLQYMLPAPIEIRSGAQVTMAIVMQPSITTDELLPFITFANYTVLYEDAA